MPVSADRVDGPEGHLSPEPTSGTRDATWDVLSEHIKDLIILTDLNGTVFYVSPSCRNLGYSQLDLVGRRAVDFLHPDDLAPGGLDASLPPTGADRSRESRGERRFRCMDGSWVWLEGNPSPLESAPGVAVGRLNILRDVTAQRANRAALEESEHRYRLLAEHATDMISLTSGATGQITYLSPSVERVTGYSGAELIGTRIAALVHPADKAGFAQTFADLRAGLTEEGRPIRFRARAKTGGWIWLESNPRLVRGADGAVTDIIDVTREVSDEEMLKAQLRTALAEAQHAAAVKAEFLANMSHEIRTPLTAVLGFAGLLGERADLDATAKAQVGRIVGASRALLAVVNDVLDFSKLEAGEVTIRRAPASAERAAREVLEMFALQAGAKGVDLRFEAAVGLPGSLLIDEDRLRQILINLVGNAVKFTERGRVSVALSYGADGRLVVEVSDTGPGIAPQAKAMLFQRFSQIDGSSTRSKGGSGLGLAICQGLARAMDGEVTVTSRVGRGSTFRLALPALRALAKDAEGRLGVDLETLCGLRVLVADDNVVNRELARAILELAGVEVSEAVDGLEAVEAAVRTPFDAILMDLRMPGLDGCQALAAIRGQPGPNQHMPVLAFSADGLLDAARAAGSGFQGVVRKPTSPGELLRAVARAIGADQALEDGARYAVAS